MTAPALLLCAAVAAQQPNPIVLAQAESLLVVGDLEQARATLEDDWAHLERDPQALLLLGRIYLDRPVVGRYRAWNLFRRAADYAPADPEPQYWQAVVGRRLGDDEGGSLIRRALFRLWERDPDYRDSWQLWSEVYHSDDDLEHAVDILARHSDDAGANFRRAQLLTELGNRAAAVPLLDSLIAGGRDDAAVWALRAQAALAAGDTETGMDSYERAVARAATDSLGILWRQVEAIATPEEDSLYATLEPQDRPAFFRAFWASREPDLTTQQNERVAEHFQRLAYARDNYRLLHPQSRFHRSPTWRTLHGTGLDDESAAQLLGALHEFYLSDAILPGFSRYEEEIQLAGLGTSSVDVVEPDSLTRYRRYGLDGRGLMYVRFGAPVRQYVDHNAELEAWEYEIDGRVVSVTMARRSSGYWGGGDMILYPLGRRIAHNSNVMLERDATSLDAELDMDAWVATFRGNEPGIQFVYVRGSVDSSVAVLWDPDWREVARSAGAGLHILESGAGQHHLGLDAHRDGRLGRIRSDYFVRPLWTGHLLVSSLLLAPGELAAASRDATARAMPPALEFPVDAPLALYAEIYGLQVNRDGVSVYEVEYRFEPLDGGDPVSFVFQRRGSANPTTVERITLSPGRVPSGRYRIVLSVRDRVDPALAQTSRIDVELR